MSSTSNVDVSLRLNDNFKALFISCLGGDIFFVVRFLLSVSPPRFFDDEGGAARFDDGEVSSKWLATLSTACCVCLCSSAKREFSFVTFACAHSSIGIQVIFV